MQVPHHPRLVAVLLLIGLVAALVVVPPAIGWETADSGGTVSEPAPEETQGAEPAAEAAPEEHADGADADLGIMDQSSQAAAEATQAEAPPAAPPAEDDDHGRDEDDDIGLMENLPGADGTTPPSAAAAGPVAGAVPPAGSGSNGRGEGSGQPSAIDEVDALKTLVQAWTAQGARQRPVRKWTDLVGDLEDLASRVAALHAANPGDIDLGVANADVKKFLVAARQARAYTAARNQVEANRGNHAWEAQLSPPKGLPTEDQDKVTLLDQDSAVDRLFTGTGKQELVEELLSQGLKEWSPLPQNPATTPAQDVDLDDLDHTTATFPIEGPSVEELVVGAGTTALGVGVGLLMLRSIDGAEKFCAFPGACALKGP